MKKIKKLKDIDYTALAIETVFLIMALRVVLFVVGVDL